MTLTDEDIHSPTWKKVRAWADDQIDALRISNDSESLTPDKTASIRGQLKALKKLVALANPAPPIVASDSD